MAQVRAHRRKGKLVKAHVRVVGPSSSPGVNKARKARKQAYARANKPPEVGDMEAALKGLVRARLVRAG